MTAGTVASPAAPGATPAAASCPNTVTATCGEVNSLYVRLRRLAGAVKLHLSVQLMISETAVWTPTKWSTHDGPEPTSECNHQYGSSPAASSVR